MSVREKIFAEVFHTTKKSVLVCRTDPAFRFVFDFVQQHPATQAVSAANLTVPATSFNGSY
jgi:hypothetical protein